MSFYLKMLDICISFGKIGLFALGGGNSTLQMMEYETVDNHSWITTEEFSQLIGATYLFPGLTSVKLSAIIGYKVGGFLGSFLAFTCLNLPGAVLTLLGLSFLRTFEGHPKYDKLMIIVEYGAVAMLIAFVYSFAEPLLNTKFSLIYFMGALLLVLAIVYDFSPFWGFILFIGFFFLLPIK